MARVKDRQQTSGGVKKRSIARLRRVGPVQGVSRAGGITGLEARRIKAAAGQKQRAFKPFVAPTRPPTGTYDPSLDQQLGASERGLADLMFDTDTQRGRLTSDFGIGMGEVDRQAGYATQDLDLGISRTRQDYGIASSELQRQMGLLAGQQAEQQSAVGLVGGGGAQAASVMRGQNQAREQGALNLTLARANESDAMARTRLSQNVTAQKGGLGLDFTRGGQDLTTGLLRGQREGAQFAVDLGAQRFYQAKNSGLYTAPTKPANEKSKAGVTYRVRGEGTGRKYTLPSGRQFSRSEWVNTWRQRARGQGPLRGTLRG